ncbi:TPA: isopentenyl-diphosphate Delta-isomerase [Stenotrophomonas maltophilia]|nr:isopentenyl-diphosphate Delta-isomerase [Stenotrophomonas maltophilia]
MDISGTGCIESPLIAVSASDEPLRPIGKEECHGGEGTLHRAFSVFLFDRQGRVLLQQRSALKPLWPGYWANSCCSHPRWGEDLAQAVVRRVREELGVLLTSPLNWHFSFTYHARYLDVGSEHELCHVFSAVLESTDLIVDPSEISAYRWVDRHALDALLRDAPDAYSPWLKIEWPKLREAL